MLNFDRLHIDPRHGRRLASGRARAARTGSPRRGFAVVWLIVWVPLLMILSALAIDVANTWLARVELENGLEAAALAAVKQWAETPSGETMPARQVGVAYAAQNTVRGSAIEIGTNYVPDSDPARPNPNENLACEITAGTPIEGTLVFGALVTTDPANPVTFVAGVEPDCGSGTALYAVRAQATIEVPTLWLNLLGTVTGNHTVTARTTAVYDCGSGSARLIELDDFVGN